MARCCSGKLFVENVFKKIADISSENHKLFIVIMSLKALRMFCEYVTFLYTKLQSCSG